MPAVAIHPRSATEIIDASFLLLRRYYPQLVALSVVALLPYMVLTAITRGPTTDPMGALMVFIAQLFCTALAEAAVIVAVSDSYLEGNVDIRRALLRTLARLPSIFGAGLIRGLAVLVATIAFILPGVYVWLRTFSVTPVLLLEDRSAGEAVSRSWRLGKGEVGKIFITLLLAWLIYLVLFVVLLMLAGIFGEQNPRLVSLLTAVMLALVYPFTGVVTTLLYYDLRVRHEGFDLELMAREAPAASTGAAPEGSAP